jgi:hypothetical protein
MDPKTTVLDSLRNLDLFDPDTGKLVRSGLKANPTNPSPDALAVLVEETIWGLSLEVSFGQAVARGMLSLIRRAPGCLHRYRTGIRRAGEKGPTLGRLMAIHLVPVLISGCPPIRHLFFEAFEIMENAGAYTLTKPLAALDRILDAGDYRSAEAYLSLLCCTFSREMTYNRCQQLTVLLPKAALQYAPDKRPGQLQQLERVMRIDDWLASALLTGMDKGLALLSVEALSRFVSQGLERNESDQQRAEKFFALESRAGRSSFDELQVAASFHQVQPQLNRYLQARTGREISVRPLSTLPRCATTELVDGAGTCSDGKTIYLPDEVGRFDSRTDNMRVYKCLTRFEAGLHEFGTLQFDLEKALELCSEHPRCFHLSKPGRSAPDRADLVSDQQRFFGLFPQPLLAEDLFLIFEHGRIRHLLATSYPGLVSACLPMFQQEARVLLARRRKRQPLLPVYARIACGLPLHELRRDFLSEIRLVRIAADLYETAMQQGDPTAESSGQLAALSYSAVANFLAQRGHLAADVQYRPLQTPFQRRIRPDLHQLSGLPMERMARSIKKQLAARGVHIYASVLRDHLVCCGGELRPQDIEEILRRPENHTHQGCSGRQPSSGDCIELSTDEIASIAASEFVPPHAPHSDGPSFWYREWDCRLGDYLTQHTRVRECFAARRSSDFYALTLTRHAGLVQRIRQAFELLKPQGLKWYRCWIEGDEFDYRQLLDFALDRKAGRTPSERLYIKRIKAQRDVAVLLLVDLSRSTANAVAGSDASVLDVEKEAIVLLSEALQVVGDRFAIDGFSGTGRLGVEYFRVKDFSDPLDDAVRSRINAMSSRRNTRMGAAIRHAASRLSAEPSRVKLLIILGDGFPNDLNYKKAYAVEDTRRAIAELRSQGIHVHAITVNIHPANTSRLDELFGDIHHNLITEVTDLPDRLWRIYGALTR